MNDLMKTTFAPARAAIDLLTVITHDDKSPRKALAQGILEQWKSCLATDEQIAMVDTSDELEIDDYGCCVSEGDDGFFVQTWTWVELPHQPTGMDEG